MKIEPSIVSFRRILEEFIGDIDISEIEIIRSGPNKSVARVNNTWIFKIQTSGKSRDLLREIMITSILSDCPIKIPEYGYIYHSPTKTFGGYRLIDGTGLQRTKRLSSVMIGQFYDFRQFLISKSYTARRMSIFEKFNRIQWGKKYETFIMEFTREAESHKLGIDLTLLHELLEKFISKDIKTMRPTLIHGDLYRDNVVIDHDRRRINGIIDFGDTCLGDPALDYAAFAMDFITQLEDIMNGTTEYTDENFANRMMFYISTEPIYSILVDIQRGMAVSEETINIMNRRMENAR